MVGVGKESERVDELFSFGREWKEEAGDQLLTVGSEREEEAAKRQGGFLTA